MRQEDVWGAESALLRECSNLVNCSWGRPGGGRQSSCENTSVGVKGSFSHQASLFMAAGYVIMSTREPHWFVSTVLDRGGPAHSVNRRAYVLPPECGNWQGGPALRSGSLQSFRRWTPEAGGHRGREKPPVACTRATWHGTTRAAGQRWRGTIQLRSNQITLRAAEAIVRTPQRDEFKGECPGQDFKADPSGGNSGK